MYTQTICISGMCACACSKHTSRLLHTQKKIQTSRSGSKKKLGAIRHWREHLEGKTRGKKRQKNTTEARAQKQKEQRQKRGKGGKNNNITRKGMKFMGMTEAYVSSSSSTNVTSTNFFISHSSKWGRRDAQSIRQKSTYKYAGMPNAAQLATGPTQSPTTP